MCSFIPNYFQEQDNIIVVIDEYESSTVGPLDHRPDRAGDDLHEQGEEPDCEQEDFAELQGQRALRDIQAGAAAQQGVPLDDSRADVCGAGSQPDSGGVPQDQPRHLLQVTYIRLHQHTPQ